MTFRDGFSKQSAIMVVKSWMEFYFGIAANENSRLPSSIRCKNVVIVYSLVRFCEMLLLSTPENVKTKTTKIMYTTCSELVVFMYWTGKSMNSLLTYCGLVDPRISASDKDYLPVHMSGVKSINYSWLALSFS